MSELSGRVVVVTGSSRGIGRAIAEACARAGASVVVSSRNDEAVRACSARIAEAGGQVTCVAADVTRYADVEALRDHALSTFGRLDAWVNNAGVSNGYRPLDEESPDELHDIVAINLIGHLYGARAVVPYFREHGGHLLNMAGRGYRGEATPYTAAYAATKTAIASLTRSLAAENKDAPGVSINALVPGMVATDFYVDIKTSPRLEATKDNWRYALDAFGVPLDEVGRKAAELLAEKPGARTGRIHSLLGPGRVMRGSAKMAWWGMTGKLGRG